VKEASRVGTAADGSEKRGEEIEVVVK